MSDVHSSTATCGLMLASARTDQRECRCRHRSFLSWGCEPCPEPCRDDGRAMDGCDEGTGDVCLVDGADFVGISFGVTPRSSAHRMTFAGGPSAASLLRPEMRTRLCRTMPGGCVAGGKKQCPIGNGPNRKIVSLAQRSRRESRRVAVTQTWHTRERAHLTIEDHRQSARAAATGMRSRRFWALTRGSAARGLYPTLCEP